MNVTPVSEPSGGRFTPAVFSGISQPKRSAKVHGWLGGHLQERSMCDYSLHAVATRPAEVAETLVSTKLKSTTTRGFASPGSPHVAVCLRPGTELAFENDVQTGGFLFRKKISHPLARFRHIGPHRPHAPYCHAGARRASFLPSPPSNRPWVRPASPSPASMYSPRMRLASSIARRTVSWSGLFITPSNSTEQGFKIRRARWFRRGL